MYMTRFTDMWGLLFLLSFLFCSANRLAASEPRYKGLTLNEWANKLGNENPDAAYKAAAAIAQFGQSAVPVLIPELASTNETVRINAAIALGELGPIAKAAAGNLAYALKDDSQAVREMAAVSLGLIGKEAAPAAAVALGRALADECVTVRTLSAEAIGRIGPQAAGAVPYLINALHDDDKDVRQEAAASLGKLGPSARTAVGPLLKLWRNDCEAVRRAAIRGLCKIDRATAIGSLLETIKSGSAAKKWIASEELVFASPKDSGPALNLLIGGLSSPDPAVRMSAAKCLGLLGPLARPAIPGLKNALLDANPTIRTIAADAINRIQVDATNPR
jgi:HEAT repeat protein